jgi:phosphatidylserine decarboxylase
MRLVTRPNQPANGRAVPGDILKTVPQYLIPQHTVSRLLHILTRIRLPWWKNFQIRWFIKRYQVDMRIAAEPDPLAYPHFNAFFTRALNAAARPVVSTPDAAAVPVDGTVSQAGDIESDRLLQAKGHNYDLKSLLGGDSALAAQFSGGRFATLYLSPRDYHRVHMPLHGKLRDMIYVPGRLFSVNNLTTRVVPSLFARNERVITLYETMHGPMALVLVGAINVGGIETVWHGSITPPYGKHIRRWQYASQGITLERGEEMGRFNMGSTVIVLFPRHSYTWDSTIRPGNPVQMGQRLAILEK